MDTQKFLNKYINTLTDQVKQLTLDKTMLTVQLSIVTEELEELKKLTEPKQDESYM